MPIFGQKKTILGQIWPLGLLCLWRCFNSNPIFCSVKLPKTVDIGCNEVIQPNQHIQLWAATEKKTFFIFITNNGDSPEATVEVLVQTWNEYKSYIALKVEGMLFMFPVRPLHILIFDIYISARPYPRALDIIQVIPTRSCCNHHQRTFLYGDWTRQNVKWGEYEIEAGRQRL